MRTGKNRQKVERKTVKKSVKTRPGAESYSVSEAATLLGVSIPTLKRMEAEGRLDSFRTPGGHLRISASSVEAVRERRTERARPVREASPVLQNRRERLEELTLEAQEVRARRELARLQREDEEEAEQEEAEELAREQEAAEREAELEAERERQQRQEDWWRANKEAERALAAFRAHWLQQTSQALLTPPCRWLSAAQRKEITDVVEVEINKRTPADAPRMATIIGQTIAALMESCQSERHAQQNRESIIRRALWNLPPNATDQERASATAAARAAIRHMDLDASESELLTSTQNALQPIQRAAEKRLLQERVLSWATCQLPWGKTELDAARLRRECAEILAELSEGTPETEAKEALAAAIQRACQEIAKRKASEQRSSRKAQLISQGLAAIPAYLLELKQAGEISADEYWDYEFRQHLDTVVRRTLEAELTGEESNKEIREFVQEILDSEF
jgi:excisionase family DNA binding protein